MKCSIKAIPITPPIGYEMGGYSERLHGALSVHDPLQALIFYTKVANHESAVISLDVIGVEHEFVQQVRLEAESKLGFPKEGILIQGIHTHSGPAGIRKHPRVGTIDADEAKRIENELYYEYVIHQLIGLIRWAQESAVEARLGFKTMEVQGIGLNRNNKALEIDRELGLVRIDDRDGNLLGIVANFSCHPTVMGASNYAFSADYVGAFRDAVKRFYPGCEVMFIQGASGDISTRFTRRSSDFTEVKRLGNLLAGYAIMLAEQIITKEQIQLNYAIALFDLMVRDYDSDDIMKENLMNEQEKYKEIQIAGSIEEIRKQYVNLQGIERSIRMKKSLQGIKKFETEMQYIDYGCFHFITLPGDVYSKIGIDIKRLKEDTMICGYANDSMGYIVSKQGLEENCYESFMMYTDATSHERIINVAKALLCI